MKIKSAVIMLVCLLLYATAHVHERYGLAGLAGMLYLVMLAAVLLFVILAYYKIPKPPEDK